MLKIKKVIVGLSGGVDSAVTALLLKNKGFDVHGVFMQNWDIADEQGQCSADKDYQDASLVSKKLAIPLHYVNFVKQYWNYVFTNFLKDYELGYTPNPDILCNKHIKFDYFIRYAKEHLGADAIATGHYAKTNFGPYLEHYNPDENVRLLRAECVIKDQTFFLSQVSEESLRHVMFPLGGLMKSEVKEIALENGLNQIAAKKESMGICFIGSRNFQSFITEYIDNKPGNFIDIDTNKAIGKHNGIHQWTYGQRTRLPDVAYVSYVARKIPNSTNIYVAKGWGHYALFTELFFTQKPHWINNYPTKVLKNSVFNCEFKFQHVEVLRNCTLCETNTGLVVSLESPLRAITPGQYAVFYKDNECLGSARISNLGPSTYFAYKYKVKNFKVSKSVTDSKNDDNDEEIKIRNVL